MTFVTALCLTVLVGSFIGSVRAFWRDLIWRREQRARQKLKELFRVCTLDTAPRGAVHYAQRRHFEPTGAPRSGAINGRDPGATA